MTGTSNRPDDRGDSREVILPQTGTFVGRGIITDVFTIRDCYDFILKLDF